jgi:two-component system sensor histidine kinase QseC
VAAEQGLELVFDVDDDAYNVSTDAAAIDIALTNLVTNAANFSPENGVITVGLKTPSVSS